MATIANVEQLTAQIQKTQAAQREYAKFDQETADDIFQRTANGKNAPGQDIQTIKKRVPMAS